MSCDLLIGGLILKYQISILNLRMKLFRIHNTYFLSSRSKQCFSCLMFAVFTEDFIAKKNHFPTKIVCVMKCFAVCFLRSSNCLLNIGKG